MIEFFQVPPVLSKELASLRIRSKMSGITPIDTSGRVEEETNHFVEKLVRLIPGEAIALYLFAQGIIGLNRPRTLLAWSLFCFFLTGLSRYVGTKKSGRTPQWGAVIIASVSFIVWLYNIGGPLLLVPKLHDPVTASLLIAGWTTLTTLLYEPKDLSQHSNGADVATPPN